MLLVRMDTSGNHYRDVTSASTVIYVAFVWMDFATFVTGICSNVIHKNDSIKFWRQFIHIFCKPMCFIIANIFSRHSEIAYPTKKCILILTWIQQWHYLRHNLVCWKSHILTIQVNAALVSLVLPGLGSGDLLIILMDPVLGPVP
jgi:hypothetical protein